MKLLKNLLSSKKAAIASPGPQVVAQSFNLLVDAYKDNHKITEEESTKREAIWANRDVEISRISAQKEILQSYLNQTFSERRAMIDGFFGSLERGIENGNDMLVLKSMESIIAIAKESPLKSGMEMIRDINDSSVKRLDF